MSPTIEATKAGRGALTPAEFRSTLGYGDYDEQAKRFIAQG